MWIIWMVYYWWNFKNILQNIDPTQHSLVALIHLYIVNDMVKNNIESVFLISNYVILKEERYFLMPCEYCHYEYEDAIGNNDLSSLIRIFYEIELVKNKRCLLSRD